MLQKWDEKRDFIQSSYSSGPLARILPEDVLALLGFMIARERKQS